MKARMGLGIAALVLVFLTGCATPPQTPVSLAPDTLATKTTRIGIAMTALPKVDTYLPGAGCLLCLAVASAANSSLTAHAKTLPYEDLPGLKDQAAEVIRKKGAQVVVIADDLNIETLPDFKGTGPNVAKKDFSSLKSKYNVDKLLVINVSTLGFIRTYASYVPTSDPKGVLTGTGYLVNLSNNTYEWYNPVNITKSSDGKWDEPPKFPGLTNAYFQALELGKDSFLKPLAN